MYLFRSNIASPVDSGISVMHRSGVSVRLSVCPISHVNAGHKKATRNAANRIVVLIKLLGAVVVIEYFAF